MNAAPSQSLINLLLESGVPSTEEAAQLTTNLNGGSWVSQVLDSGKVDEQRFLGAIGNFFRVPVVSSDSKKICAFGIGSTAFCTKSLCHRNCASCSPQSSRV